MLLRLSSALLIAVSLSSYTAEITPGRKAALDHISAQSLEGHVSFLASDRLEGRDTPSPGLDIAAEYIAAQFRRAGLKPAGDDGYFQTAHFVVSEQSSNGAELEFHSGDRTLRFAKDDLRVAGGKGAFAEVTPVRITFADATSAMVEGRVVAIAVERASNRDLAALARLKPAAVVIVQTDSTVRAPEVSRRLEDVDQRRTQPPYPVIRVYNSDFFKLVQASKSGEMDARISLRAPAPVEKPVDLRNVAGILPGSDPALAGTYVLVTAHYDHLGKNPAGEGDLIYNGANDDASGVASVIEIAAALSAARPAPRRSVLFMAYFGEEKGLLGSRYYGRHPLVPLIKTVAELSLEQLGRTDGDQGAHPAGTATMTGYGYSDVTSALELAGAATGVKIYDPGKAGDDFFARSDNQSLADLGVPSHAICTNFEFPDYHQVGDEWQKLDYAHLEKVDRTLALTVMMVGDNSDPPKWNEANAKTQRYVEAQRKLK